MIKTIITSITISFLSIALFAGNAMAHTNSQLSFAPNSNTPGTYTAPGHNAYINGNVAFSFGPGPDEINQLNYTLSSSTNQILIMTGAIVDPAFANALIRLNQTADHHDIRIILDRRGANMPASQAMRLTQAGIHVYVDKRHIFTDNFIIVDGRTVLTSSAPFSLEAKPTVSLNMVVIRGEPSVANIFWHHWLRHYKHCYRYADLSHTQQSRPPAPRHSSSNQNPLSRTNNLKTQIENDRLQLRHLLH